MTTPDLIEKVARAMRDAESDCNVDDCGCWRGYEPQARAAIRAVLLAQIAGAEKQPNYLWVAAWLRDFANLHQIPLTDGGE